MAQIEDYLSVKKHFNTILINVHYIIFILVYWVLSFFPLVLQILFYGWGLEGIVRRTRNNNNNSNNNNNNDNNNNNLSSKIQTFRKFFTHPTFCWARHCAGPGFEPPAVCAHLWPRPWTRSWAAGSAAPGFCPRESCVSHVRRARLRPPEDTRRTPATTSTRWWEQPSAARALLSKLHKRVSLSLSLSLPLTISCSFLSLSLVCCRRKTRKQTLFQMKKSCDTPFSGCAWKKMSKQVLGESTDAHVRRLLLVGYDSVFPRGWGKRFIFEEQLPRETPEDAGLLLDCNLSPVKGKRESTTFHNISTQLTP